MTETAQQALELRIASVVAHMRLIRPEVLNRFDVKLHRELANTKDVGSTRTLTCVSDATRILRHEGLNMWRVVLDRRRPRRRDGCCGA